MISYKLAKQLKEAGFPQKKPLFYDYTRKEKYKNPTLSELIKECGERFEALIYQKGGWVAISNMDNYMMKQNFKCVPTPSDAVAKLWIKLNKK